MLSAPLLSLILLQLGSTWAAFSPLHEYSGKTFFDKWDFYGNIDDKTWGNVTYLDAATASSTKLTDVNAAGNVIIKVDNEATIAPAELVHRNSVRIASQEAYGVGSVIVTDFLHMPYGCSVWPSFWLLGVEGEWPTSGEIDIVEGINMYDKNQMSLHTTEGCTQPKDVQQIGRTVTTDCLTVSGTDKNGCITEETKPNSYGKGFADAKGGVYAIQIDVTGVFMWFWSRADIPASITAASTDSSIDLADWGTPSAAYPAASCNVAQFFKPQKMILDITLCGLWAGAPNLYANTCPGQCVADNIIGNGSNYDTAFFEIAYIRTYGPPGSSQSASTSSGAAAPGSSAANSNANTNSSENQTTVAGGASGALGLRGGAVGALLAALALGGSLFVGL